jgi:hypothetical protein
MKKYTEEELEEMRRELNRRTVHGPNTRPATPEENAECGGGEWFVWPAGTLDRCG